VKRVVLALIAIPVLSASLWSLEWRSWSAEIGVAWQYNGEIGSAADRKQPSKIMFNPGGSVLADWDAGDDGWYFRPGAWLSWNLEEVHEGIARPCGEEKIGHMKVLGLMVDAPFGYAFALDGLTVGVQGGPSLYLRFPLYKAELGTADPAEFWKAYYGALEVLHLGISSWVAFPISDQVDLLGGLRIYQPLSPIWTEAPFFHGLQIGLFAAASFDIPS